VDMWLPGYSISSAPKRIARGAVLPNYHTSSRTNNDRALGTSSRCRIHRRFGCCGAGSGDEKSLSSLAARIPVAEVRDDLIVRRDGSFCAGWECNGVATQFAHAERLEALSSTLDAFIKSIRHPEIELQFRYVIDCE